MNSLADFLKCTYSKLLPFQIRSRNDFIVSDWSDPLDITSFNDSGDSLSGGVIGGIAAGLVIALLVAGVIFLVVFLCVNRRRKSKLLNSLQVLCAHHRCREPF